MFYSDRSVAHRPTQREEGGDLQRPEGTLAIGVSDGFAPGCAKAWRPDRSWKALGAGGVPGSQLVQRIERGVLPGGLPGQAAHDHQQRAHRRDGIDQTSPDDRRSTRRTLSALGRDYLAQARTKFGIGNSVMGRELGELLQKVLVLLCQSTEAATPSAQWRHRSATRRWNMKMS